ncbi:hypothetical protein HK097_007604 [Rhizophlyctis rosea]|uniref:Zf-CHY-domain-containing protein n=1 Tax=Rhizophlyctis rosea TaxID=64517 RepID=A0AAD5X9G6_9FUNG|nr:hypothetical protein HK097_007604 [Rhizophlyctis rosea]
MSQYTTPTTVPPSSSTSASLIPPDMLPASNRHNATPFEAPEDEIMDDSEAGSYSGSTDDYESIDEDGSERGSDSDNGEEYMEAEDGGDETESQLWEDVDEAEEEEEEEDDDEDDVDLGGNTGRRRSEPSQTVVQQRRPSKVEEDPQVLENKQTEMRKRIVAIQSDSSLSAQEKAKAIQELMSNSWNAKQKTQGSRAALASNKLENRRMDFSFVTDADRVKTYHDREEGILGCKHYQRSAKLQAHCCGKWYTCRFCHDEVSDHNIVRNLTANMMCMHCATVQPAAQRCTNPACGLPVSRYYCGECKLWDDDPRKNIYHCYDCGICRIGKGLGQDYFHCKKCNVCMAISLKGKHKCIERNLESDCPICGEYMFTSTTTVIFMPCGHCIHYKCHQEYIQTSYQCPTCFKSLANMTEYFKRIDAMLAQHTMPPEYTNTRSHIYCNDCEKKSFAKFHFLYHKCGSCGGYNSKVLETVEMAPGDVEELKERGRDGVGELASVAGPANGSGASGSGSGSRSSS